MYWDAELGVLLGTEHGNPDDTVLLQERCGDSIKNQQANNLFKLENY